MGVFAIADLGSRTRRELLLTRDRAGERPIFFTVNDGVVQFATEVAALVGESGARFTLSPDAIHEYMTIGCLAAPSSPYLEVQKVRPGEAVTISAAGTKRRIYWRWEIGRVKKAAPTTSGFDAIFREAVRSQTDIDVPFGFFSAAGSTLR